MRFVCRKSSVGGLKEQLNCHMVGMGPVDCWGMEQRLGLVSPRLELGKVTTATGT